jgi:hypothetical protein
MNQFIDDNFTIEDDEDKDNEDKDNEE